MANDKEEDVAMEEGESEGEEMSESNDESSDDESSDDESNDESNESNDESVDKDESGGVLRGEDGRELSAYEVMRLERIKRNREYLAKLGLGNQNGSEGKEKEETKSTTLLTPFTERMLKAKREKRMNRIKRKEQLNEATERRTPSRRSRKQINYAELPSITSNDDSNNLEKKKKKKKNKRKERPPKSRMPRVIFNEFKRIEKQRRQSYAEAKRILKLAQTELKFSQRSANFYIKKHYKEQRKLLHQQKAIQRKREHDVLKPLWMQAQHRQFETQLVCNNYQQWKQDALKRHQLQCQQLQTQIAHTSYNFTQHLHKAQLSLHQAFLSQCGCSVHAKPKPAKTKNTKKRKQTTEFQKNSNNSKKTKIQSTIHTSTSSTTTTLTKPTAIKSSHLSVPCPLADIPTFSSSYDLDINTTTTTTTNTNANITNAPASLQQPIATPEQELLLHTKSLDDDKLDTPSCSIQSPLLPTLDSTLDPSSISHQTMITPTKSTTTTRDTTDTTVDTTTTAPKKTKKLHARQVGGPITTQFSTQIKRTWLTNKDTPTTHNTQTFKQSYIPQVNDIVLYYPCAHQEFLQEHPDTRGTKSRLKLRMPLWQRASNTKHSSSSNKEDEEEQDTTLPKKKKEQKWYTQSWINQISTMSYPILCRVEQTHAEFPFDPNAADKKKTSKPNKNDAKQDSKSNKEDTKKTSKKNKEDEKKTSKKTTKNNENDTPKKQKKKNQQLQMELSVMLKPLTPIAPPQPLPSPSSVPSSSSSSNLQEQQQQQDKQQQQQDKQQQQEEITSLPPVFTVITFPSTSAPPFLVPFVWAYQVAQSLHVGDRVKFQFEHKGPWYHGTIHSFISSSPSNDNKDENNVVLLQKQTKQQLSNNLNRLENNIEIIFDMLSTAFGGTVPTIDQLHAVVSSFIHLVFHTSSTASTSTHGGGGGAGTVTKSLSKVIPKEELRVIVETILCHFYHHQQQPHEKKEGQRPISKDDRKSKIDSMLLNLIRRTLPLWDGVKVLWDDSYVCNVSPWELTYLQPAAPSSSNPSSTLPLPLQPQQDAAPICTLHEPLRAKIENALKDYIETKPQASIFIIPVTNAVAPAYFCFVPLGMCFRKILKRLKTHSLTLSSSCSSNADDEKMKKKSVPTRSATSACTIEACYYRSIGALLSDVMDIFHSCIGYNDPSSQIVLQAKAVAEEVKSIISNLDHEHTKEVSAKEKEEGSRHLVTLSGGVVSGNGGVVSNSEPKGRRKKKKRRGKSKAPPPLGTGLPFKTKLFSEWLQSVHPDSSWGDDTLKSTEENRCVQVQEEKMSACSQVQDHLFYWVPQCGDKILYSPLFHCQFINCHLADLREEQASLPSVIPQSLLPSDSNDKEELKEKKNEDWLVGTIVSVKAVFPPNPLTAPFPESTFDQLSPILALGVKLHYEWALGQTHFLYWRPCILIPTRKQGVTPRCKWCGLSVSSSFLQPAWRPVSHQNTLTPTLPSNISYQTLPNGISDSILSSINSCFDSLKRRCIDGIPPDFVDLTSAHQSMNDVDLDSHFLSLENVTNRSDHHSKLTAAYDSTATVKQAQTRLFKMHFLPPWSAPSPTKQINATASEKAITTGLKKEIPPSDMLPTLQSHEQILPLPLLCLELIRCRLKSTYYRQIDSVINDIHEAYVSSILFLCAEYYNKDEDGSKGGFIKFMKRIAILIRQNRIGDTQLEKADLLTQEGITPALPTKAETKNSIKSPSSVANDSTEKNEKASYDDDGTAGTNLSQSLSDEEISILSKIKSIRSLYATAFVCLYEPSLANTVFTNTFTEKRRDLAKKRIKQLLDEQHRESAREKVFLLSNALKQDPCKFRRPMRMDEHDGPLVRIKIVFQDKHDDMKNETEHLEKDHLSANKSADGDETPKKVTIEAQNDETSAFERVLDAAEIQSEDDKNAKDAETNKSKVDTSINCKGPKSKENRNAQKDGSSDAADVRPNGSCHTKDLELSNIKMDASDGTKTPFNEGNASAKHGGNSICEKLSRAVEPQTRDNGSIDISQSIELKSQDYIYDDELTKAIFGVGDRQDTCTHCKLKKSSFFFCRIKKAHSNPDFDWADCLESSGGINGLFHQMMPSVCPPPSDESSTSMGANIKISSTMGQTNKNNVAIISQSSPGVCQGQLIKSEQQSSDSNMIVNASNEYRDAKEPIVGASVFNSDVISPSLADASSSTVPENFKSADTTSQNAVSISGATKISPPSQAKPVDDSNIVPSVNGDDSAPKINSVPCQDSSQQITDHGETKVADNDPCPLRVLAIAERALQMAKGACEFAEKETNSKPILSESFIRHNFPIDSVDGHYEYCTVCGLSGDIMCCESCPNVAHPRCVDLEKVPEGDWFCKKCYASKQKSSNENLGEKGHAEKQPDDHVILDSVEDSATIEQGGEENEERTNNWSQGVSELVIENVRETWEDKLKHLEGCKSLEDLVEGLRSIRLRGKLKEKSANKVKRIQQEDTSASTAIETGECPPSADAGADGDESETPKQNGENTIGNDVDSLVTNEKDTNQDYTEQDDDESMNEEKAQEDFSSEDHELKNGHITRFSLGTNIVKSFESYGEFKGVVTRVPTEEEPFYRVQYEDGDEEDMSGDELEKYVRTVVDFVKEEERPKRRRGRPRKKSTNYEQLYPTITTKETSGPERRKRGRPKKNRAVAT